MRHCKSLWFADRISQVIYEAGMLTKETQSFLDRMNGGAAECL